MSRAFDVDDALAIRHVTDVVPNADGSRVGYRRFEDGRFAFCHAPTPAPAETTLDESPSVTTVAPSLDGDGADGVDESPHTDAVDPATVVRGGDEEPPDVDAAEWRPDHPDEAVLLAGGDLFRYHAADDECTPFAVADGDHAAPTWLDADTLAVARDEALYVHGLSDGSVRRLALGAELDAPFGPPTFEPAPSGRRVAALVTGDADPETPTAVAVYDRDAADVVWSYRPDPTDDPNAVADLAWADDETLVYAMEADPATERHYRAVDVTVDEGPGTTLLSESAAVLTAQPGRTGSGDGAVALLSSRTGHAHAYVVEVAERRAAVSGGDPGFAGDGVRQLTAGDYEARGDANEAPEWSPDGDRLAVATNEADPGERRLRVYDRDGDLRRALAPDPAGNVVHPSWEVPGLVVCRRSGRTTPGEGCVVGVDPVGDEGDAAEGDTDAAGGDSAEVAGDTGPGPATGVFARVSDAADDVDLSGFPAPDPVEFPGTADPTLRGYRYAPPEAEPGDHRPAVVWCHGGPVRQMRRGFHHMRSYGRFHAFNHVLLERGYVVLELNYRGGIGYGHEFQAGLVDAIGADDVNDCVRAVEFLRDDPVVGDRVGLWGLSYGGYLAAAVAARTDVLDCAIDVAGVWDWATWVGDAAERGWGAGRRFAAYFDGYPTEPAAGDAYRRGSPATAAGDVDVPFLALHGTDDPNVPFDQMDALVADLVASGVPFEQAYYPEEDHMFRDPAVWRDAMGRALSVFAEHLETE